MRVLLWLRSLVFRRRLEREMREEMATHFTQTVERLKAEGLSHADARRAARREFGNVDALRDDARDARGGQGLDSLVSDLRFGFRQFARRPFATITMVVVLALGIGFNAVLFLLTTAFIDNVPPGVTPEPSLVRIRGGERSAGRGFTIGREFSYPEFREYAAQTTHFAAVAAWTSSDITIDVGRHEESLHSGAATFVTANYFQVLGLRPVAGAGLRPDAKDDATAPELSAVISHVVWDRYYGRAADVVGQAIKVNGVPFTIAGVAPRRFNGARSGGSQVRVWLPLNARPVVLRTTPALTGYDTAIYGLLARLQPGVREEQALPIAQMIAARAGHQMTSGDQRVLSTDVPPLLAGNYFPPSNDSQDDGRPIVASTIPFLVPLLVLSITCTTVSALQAGLAIARRREMAVRLALGAPRRRIVRQLLTESAAIALAAGAFGLFVIWILLRTFESAIPDLYITLDWRHLFFTGGIALAAGILFGLSPALHATRLSVGDILKDAASAFVPSRSRLQAGLVVAQIALTQPALLAMGALFLEMVHGVRDLPASVRADRILEIRFNTNPRYGAMDDSRERTLARLQAHLAAVPGVVAVVPQENQDDSVDVAVHTMDQVPGVELQATEARVHAAPPGYFAMMSMPFVLGRDFDPADSPGAIVIGAGTARRLWGDVDPIGRRLVNTTPSLRRTSSLTVVGVVDDSRAGGVSGSRIRVFVPDVALTGHFLIQTSGPAQAMTSTVRSVANATAPDLSLISARTLATIEAGERTTFVRAIAAAGGVGTVALFLSAIGLYAVISFAVSQRVREIGIRTALGADRRRLLALFLRRGLGLSLGGVVVGLAFSVAAMRIIAAVNGEEPPAGTAAVAAVTTAVVAVVALLATWLPARRATRIDPLQALRLE
jgi:putative ABC transport system permease protein